MLAFTLPVLPTSCAIINTADAQLYATLAVITAVCAHHWLVYHHALSKEMLAIDAERSTAVRYVPDDCSFAVALLRCCMHCRCKLLAYPLIVVLVKTLHSLFVVLCCVVR
jgi:hypothetical protein